jgi:hypothetical protein
MIRSLFVVAALAALPAPALACGGLFCSGVNTPVVQTAERVLFEVHGDGTVTAVVEIQFEGEATEFGWVVPIPHVIDPAMVSTQPPGLFDELEELTAPRFRAPETATADAVGITGWPAFYDSGCGAGCGRGVGLSGGVGVPFLPENVEVVGEAVVGPYAVEIITAEEALDLTIWLQQAGYRIPGTAVPVFERYLDQDMAFLGLKLDPDVPAGPIDAISFTFTAEDPMLPLLLTAIAAVPDMDIITYVLADERYAPANYGDARIDDSLLEWDAAGGTNYDELLVDWMDEAGGAAFATEFAQPTERFAKEAELGAELLAGRTFLTRFRTLISPEEMTHDPCWEPAPGLPDVDNWHNVSTSEAASVAGFGGCLIFLLLLGRRRWL